MNIRIYARTFFENKIGTAEEERLLDECRIISINDVSLHPEPPPFSRRFLVHPNLLVLHFDDVETEMPTAFSIEQARQIVRFVLENGALPFLIHCTAGISRSGAVGLAIAEQCGCVEEFRRGNPDIMPNQLVLQKLRQAFLQSELGISRGDMMTRKELVADIKRSVPDIVEMVGDDFDWNGVADMVEGKKPVPESSDDGNERAFEEYCVYTAYMIDKGELLEP